MKPGKYSILAVLLSLCVLLETLAATYMQQLGKSAYYSSSLLYAFMGLLIAILPLFHNSAPISSSRLEPKVATAIPWLAGAIFLGLLVYHIVLLAPLFQNWPIDKKWADMIPMIQLACNRFLKGQLVYTSTPEINLGYSMSYPPMMWMPFLPSQIFGFDARWTTVFAMFIGLFVALMPLLKKQKTVVVLPFLITCTALFLMLNVSLR